MLNYYLKRVLLIFLIGITSLTTIAQQTHFVYLQTENGNPFYVRMNNKVVSSSPAGYVILPNMEDGDYQLVIGFPKNEFPEEGFKISVDKKNEGFLVKNFEDKGWALFNLQSLALLPGTNSTVAAANIPTTVAPAEKKQDDAFSTMLADVVKDSSILQKNEPVTSPNDIVSSKQTTDVSPDLSSEKNPDSAVKGEDPKTDEVLAKVGVSTPISKILGIDGNEGMQMIYLDNATNDTIRVFIPATAGQNPGIVSEQKNNASVSKEAVATAGDTSSVTGAEAFKLSVTPAAPVDSGMITIVEDTLKIYKESVRKEQNTASTQQVTVEKENVVPESSPSGKTEGNKNGPTVTLLPKVVTSSKVNSDCKAFATTEDFLRLRKKMASENSNDGMVQAAKKIFRTRCFSTEQIRNLSYLFLTDEGKYMFFDAAYAFTSDSDQYQLLKSQLKDDYYIKRFDAMIHN